MASGAGIRTFGARYRALDGTSRMKAVILAAGRGSRMGDLTDARPKCLVEFKGRRLIDWQLSALRKAGIADIAVVTGYRREALAGLGLFEFHNSRWAETQMVASLACASPWLSEGPCIVSYSDIFYESAAVEILARSTADIAIAFDPDWSLQWTKRFGDPLKDAETFKLRDDGMLAEIGGRPMSVGEVEGQYMGLLRFSPDGWAALDRTRSGLSPERQDRVDMTGILQLLIDSGVVPIGAHPYKGYWGELDSIADLIALGGDPTEMRPGDGGT